MSMAQLRGSACAAALFSSGAVKPWALRSTQLPTGLALSNNGRTLTNVSAGDNFLPGVWTDKTIYASSPPVYWEVLVGARGAGANFSYVGFSATTFEDVYNTGLHFTGSLAYSTFQWREDGAIWLYGGQNLAANAGRAYVAGDVLGIAFAPETGDVWFSKNGTYLLVTPVVLGQPAAYRMRVLGDFKPTLHCRDQGDVMTLRTTATEFTYSPPTGFIPLAEAIAPPKKYVPIPLTNPGAERNNNTGWTIVAGTLATYGAGSSRAIGQSFENGGANPAIFQQTLRVPSSLFLEIDAGSAFAICTTRYMSSVDFPTCRFLFQLDFLNAAGTIISTLESDPLWSDFRSDRDMSWRFAIPANTRRITYRIRHNRPVAGQITFDDFRFGIMAIQGAMVRTAGIGVVQGKPQNVVGVRASRTYAIIVP